MTHLGDIAIPFRAGARARAPNNLFFRPPTRARPQAWAAMDCCARTAIRSARIPGRGDRRAAGPGRARLPTKLDADIAYAMGHQRRVKGVRDRRQIWHNVAQRQRARRRARRRIGSQQPRRRRARRHQHRAGHPRSRHRDQADEFDPCARASTVDRNGVPTVVQLSAALRRHPRDADRQPCWPSLMDHALRQRPVPIGRAHPAAILAQCHADDDG